MNDQDGPRRIHVSLAFGLKSKGRSTGLDVPAIDASSHCSFISKFHNVQGFAGRLSQCFRRCPFAFLPYAHAPLTALCAWLLRSTLDRVRGVQTGQGSVPCAAGPIRPTLLGTEAVVLRWSRGGGGTGAL